jgi:uncharacterized repeat protein (TIGR01451 family)
MEITRLRPQGLVLAACIALGACGRSGDDLGPRTDIIVAQTAAPNAVGLGGTARFTVSVTNAGPATARLVPLYDVASSNLTVSGMRCDATGGAVCPAVLGAAMSTSDWPSAGTLTFTVTATLNSATGPITNTFISDFAADMVSENNTSTVALTLLAAGH